MTEVWNNVTIYGPSQDIGRFQRACLEPEEQVYRDGQSGWDGCGCTLSLPPTNDVRRVQRSSGEYLDYVWNFQQFKPASTVEYSFSFDSDHGFPVQTFERLASRFPRLAFDCTCIESMDEFMGYGWFNAPLGGEEFRQDFHVPANYWTSGGGQKRGPEAQAQHDARIVKLKATALDNDSNVRLDLRYEGKT